MLNSVPPSPLSSVYSPWDQSGWRCERGRCRCSRSRQRGELHRPSRASRARPTRGVQMHVASAGVAAVAVPGRSSPPENSLVATQHGRRYCTQDSTAWATVSQQQAPACVLCSWYFCMWSVDICLTVALLHCKTYLNISLLFAVNVGNVSSWNICSSVRLQQMKSKQTRIFSQGIWPQFTVTLITLQHSTENTLRRRYKYRHTAGQRPQDKQI